MAGRVGLVGLGLVGTAAARRLSAEGFEVLGFDVDRRRCERLEQAGVRIAGSCAELGERVERAILSLPDAGCVLEVVEGPAGLLDTASPPGYILDTTTAEPDQTAALAERLAKRGVHFLDAPFSGSSAQLADKQVVFMVGGQARALQRCRDILDALGKKTFHVGRPGSGLRAKLASNLVIGLNRLALAEGLVFAERLGLDAAAFLEMLKVTPAYSAAMDAKGGKMLAGDFAPQARLRQHCKDVSIILKYAEQSGQELPLSRLHRELLESAIAAGDGDLDNSAVIREIRRRRTDSGRKQL